jgi:hypothetical protein
MTLGSLGPIAITRKLKKKQTTTLKKHSQLENKVKKKNNVICVRFIKQIITSKGVHLLTMGRFNRGLVLNKFFMDKIKYGWNILNSHTK